MNSSVSCNWAMRLGTLLLGGAMVTLSSQANAQTSDAKTAADAPNETGTASAGAAAGSAPVSGNDGAVNAGSAPAGEKAEVAKDEKKEEAKEEAKEEKEEAKEEKEEEKPTVEFSGAVEISYAYNLNNPSNRVTAWRWYDYRHDVVGLQNAMLTTSFNKGPVSGQVQLQLGNFAEVFWDAGRGPEQDLLWRLMQQATLQWTTPYEKLSIEGGAFNVPFGPEWNAAYLNWTWSAGNLFALMPYQIGGVRANMDLGRGWTARLGVYNGWDQIVTDNNKSKSVMVSFEWEKPDDEETYFYFNYMIGNERDEGDSRGPYARHTFDVYGQVHATESFYARAHVFTGFEPVGGGSPDGWLGGSVAAKLELTDWLSIAGRGDVVYTFSSTAGENLFHSDTLELTGRNLGDSTLLGSVTGTIDVHTASNVALRLEARHDRADFPLFFKGQVQQDATTGEDIPTATNQTTLTAGLTTWF